MADGQGIPIGLSIASANTHDIRIAKPTVESMPQISGGHGRYLTLKGLAADKGFDSDEFRAWLRDRGIRSDIPDRASRRRGRGRHPTRKPELRAVRWMNERTHSWMNNYRRLRVRWERDGRLYEALGQFACALIAFKHWWF